MASYTVYEQSRHFERGDAPIFVRDGFAWSALPLPGLWFLARRVYRWALAYILAMGALGGFVYYISPQNELIALMVAAIHAIFAAEAYNLQRRGLVRRGFRLSNLANGHSVRGAQANYAAIAEHRRNHDIHAVNTVMQQVSLAPGGSAWQNALLGFHDRPFQGFTDKSPPISQADFAANVRAASQNWLPGPQIKMKSGGRSLKRVLDLRIKRSGF